MTPVKAKVTLSYADEEKFHTLYPTHPTAQTMSHTTSYFSRYLNRDWQSRSFRGSSACQKHWFQSSGHCPRSVPEWTCNVVESVETVRSKGGRTRLKDVKVSDRLDYSFMFYSPTVVRNGTPFVCHAVFPLPSFIPLTIWPSSLSVITHLIRNQTLLFQFPSTVLIQGKESCQACLMCTCILQGFFSTHSEGWGVGTLPEGK